MSFPVDQKVIDLMLAIPISSDNSEWYESMRPLLMDEESRNAFKMPAQYLFKDIPDSADTADRVGWTIDLMDLFRIERAMTPFDTRNDAALIAHSRHRDRFLFELGVSPNEGMAAVRAIRTAKRNFGIDAVSVFPAGLNPQVPINDKRLYPVYAACVEENLPIFVTVGVPGPRTEIRDAPRGRASRGHGGQADAEIPEPLLLHFGLRAEALSEGHHRLHEFARCAKGHVCRLFSDGAQPRADFRGDAGTSSQAGGVAPISP
jgi:predicted TIM-barrel fold metal-dependent hydrolase